MNSKEWEGIRKALTRAILPDGGTIYEHVTRDQIMTDVVAALRAIEA